jgi:hypothetical protein
VRVTIHRRRPSPENLDALGRCVTLRARLTNRQYIMWFFNLTLVLTDEAPPPHPQQ